MTDGVNGDGQAKPKGPYVHLCDYEGGCSEWGAFGFGKLWVCRQHREPVAKRVGMIVKPLPILGEGV
jgi:hypothetical protein